MWIKLVQVILSPTPSYSYLHTISQGLQPKSSLPNTGITHTIGTFSYRAQHTAPGHSLSPSFLPSAPENRFPAPLHRYPLWTLCLEEKRTLQLSTPDSFLWPAYVCHLLQTVLAPWHRTGQLSCLFRGQACQHHWSFQFLAQSLPAP